MRPVKTQIIFRCKGSQILPFVVTNRHVNSSSWRDYKSLVKYVTVSVKVLHAFCCVRSGSALFVQACLSEYVKYGNSIKSNPFRNHPGSIPDS